MAKALVIADRGVVMPTVDPPDITGACCLGEGQIDDCVENTSAECAQLLNSTFHKGVTCAEYDCNPQPPETCPSIAECLACPGTMFVQFDWLNVNCVPSGCDYRNYGQGVIVNQGNCSWSGAVPYFVDRFPGEVTCVPPFSGTFGPFDAPVILQCGIGGHRCPCCTPPPPGEQESRWWMNGITSWTTRSVDGTTSPSSCPGGVFDAFGWWHANDRCCPENPCPERCQGTSSAVGLSPAQSGRTIII